MLPNIITFLRKKQIAFLANKIANVAIMMYVIIIADANLFCNDKSEILFEKSISQFEKSIKIFEESIKYKPNELFLMIYY